MRNISLAFLSRQDRQCFRRSCLLPEGGGPPPPHFNSLSSSHLVSQALPEDLKYQVPAVKNPLYRPSPSTIPPSPPPPLPGISWHLLVSHHLSQDSLKKGAQISTHSRMLSQCRWVREEIQSHLVQSNWCAIIVRQPCEMHLVRLESCQTAGLHST